MVIGNDDGFPNREPQHHQSDDDDDDDDDDDYGYRKPPPPPKEKYTIFSNRFSLSLSLS